MAHRRDSVDLGERIAKANIACEAWRSAGFSEKYLEAYSSMEALEAELVALVDTHGETGTTEAVRTTVEAAASLPVASVQLMAELSIAYDGLRYYYDSYRYDRLDDAVNYARLQRSRAGSQSRISMPKPAIFQPPGDDERRAMASSGITYAEGVYRLGEYRYDRLDDALAYARLQRLPGDG